MQTDGILILLSSRMYVCVGGGGQSKGGRCGGCVQKKESGEHRQKGHLNLGRAKFIKTSTQGDGIAPF